jgi:hypothetical protein
MEIRCPSNALGNISKPFKGATTTMQFHNVCCYGKLGCVCVGGGGKGEGGEERKAPIKKFMLLVLHLPIACADAEGEYLNANSLSIHT